MPIVEDESNRDDYRFIDYQKIWRLLRIFGKTSSKNKIRFHIYCWLLNRIKPKYILEINWIGRLELFHYLYAKKSKKTTTIVVQHGAYQGGLVGDRGHKMLRCSFFWVWSSYWENQFILNKGQILVKGNPIYNKNWNSRTLEHKKSFHNRKMLVVLSYEDLYYKFEVLIQLLNISEFEYEVKLRKGRNVPVGIKSAPNLSVYELFSSGNYDFIITDFSTTAIDAHFFKIPFTIVYDSDFENHRFDNYYLTEFDCVDLKSLTCFQYEYLLKGALNNCNKKISLYREFISNTLF